MSFIRLPAAASAVAVLLVAGCARFPDAHAPKTVTAGAEGGAVTVSHGARLRIPLAADPGGTHEWRRVEPPIVAVMLEGPPQQSGMDFTPVRSGTEKLRFELRPAREEGVAKRVVSYDVKVP